MWSSTCCRSRGRRCCITLVYHTFPRVSLLISLSLSLSLTRSTNTHMDHHFLQLSTEWKQWLTRRDDERESARRWDRKTDASTLPGPRDPPFFFFFFFWPTRHYICSKFPCEWEAHMFQCVSNQHSERESSKSNTYVSAQLRTTSLVRESEACPQIQRQTEMLLLKFGFFLSLSLSPVSFSPLLHIASAYF